MNTTLKDQKVQRIPLHQTKNDMSGDDRAKIVDLLNARLAEAIDLYLQSKVAHWNVKGPQFGALHELFDKVAQTVEDGVDELAERAVMLGGTAQGTLQIVSKTSRLAAYPLDISKGSDHVDALSSALAAYGKNVRAAIETAAKIGDADTADLFTGISREIDKYLWFVEAHQQSKS